MSVKLVCIRCSSALPASGFFCPMCGWDRRRAGAVKITLKQGLGFAVLVAAVWSAVSLVSASLAGKKPTQTQSSASEIADDALKDIREKAKQGGTLEDLRTLATALISQIKNNSAPPSQGQLLELIDTMSKILAADPKDSEALLILGDVSFEQQVYDKALDYYKRYLDVKPEDLSVRARYASSLTVQGNPDRAISELNEILKKQPDFFAAMAYLTVAYAQAGKLTEAEKAGAEAISKAPSPEAAKELEKFLERTKSKASLGGKQAASTGIDKNTNEKPPEPTSSLDKLAQYFRNNPVAGPKFVDLRDNGKGVVKAKFKDFPMSAMPPFAKEKFFSGIKKTVKDLGIAINSLEFRDASNGELLAPPLNFGEVETGTGTR